MNINKKELLEALEIVKPGLSTKEIIEQSTSFAFIKGKIITYNDEISISHPVKNLKLTGAIKADEFYKLLSKLKGDEIEIDIQEAEILLKSGKAKAGITLQKEIRLPLEEVDKPEDWKALPDNFIHHLRFAMGACTSDMSRPILTCVNICSNGTLYASDSYRLVEAKCSKKMGVNDFLLPASSAVHVVKLNPTQICLGNGWVHFKTEGGTVLSCRVFEDIYPDITPHIEVKGMQVEFPKTIKDVLDRASVFAKRDHFLDEQLDITIGNNRIKVKGQSDAGWFEEECNMRYDKEPVTLMVTPYLMQDILNESHQCTVSKDKMKFQGEDWTYIALLRMSK